AFTAQEAYPRKGVLRMVHKVIILGSGPAGYTAALYAGRANHKPLMIDGGVGQGQDLLGAGGQLMITTDVENYPGFEDGIQGPELMMIMRSQALRFGTEIVEDIVTNLDLSRRPFKVWVGRSEEHTSELQSRGHLVCRLLLET